MFKAVSSSASEPQAALLKQAAALPAIASCHVQAHAWHAGMSGFSMGGVHASMVASLYPGNIACTPLLAPRSASGAFCHGALRSATSWAPLAAVVDEKQQVTQHAAAPCMLLVIIMSAGCAQNSSVACNRCVIAVHVCLDLQCVEQANWPTLCSQSQCYY